MQGSASEPGAEFGGRLFGRGSALPEHLDFGELELVDGPREEAGDVQKLEVPDLDGAVAAEDQARKSESLHRRRRKAPGTYTRSIDSRSTVGMNRALR